MDKTNCTIYIGQYFTLEWYYDKNGYSQAYEYFLAITQEQRRKFLILAKRIGDFGKISDKTKFRSEDDKIYEFKPQPDRYLCFFIKGKKIIVTNAFTKKTAKLPEQEKNTCIKRREDYLQRNKEN
ncbi:MAG: type II toxin-antitoxin system RelE/ParE family toxin [Treponemataceae bacterium]|nr:type II toxin-antitoxin system RelE/ParE family toxin [Treponemataceae bacterium]